jgi:hypothetical protein
MQNLKDLTGILNGLQGPLNSAVKDAVLKLEQSADKMPVDVLQQVRKITNFTGVNSQEEAEANYKEVQEWVRKLQK